MVYSVSRFKGRALYGQNSKQHIDNYRKLSFELSTPAAWLDGRAPSKNKLSPFGYDFGSQSEGGSEVCRVADYFLWSTCPSRLGLTCKNDPAHR